MDEKDTGRLEAFSDGVFAVAITLLILNIKVQGVDAPPYRLLDDASLWSILLNQWPMFDAYITSFLTIGIMWINHHRLFKHIQRTDTALLLLNLLLLLVIVFIPVPTALLAEYLVNPAFRTAAFLYAGTCVIMACCFNLLWRYASQRNRLLGKNVDTYSVRRISQQYAFGPLLYVLAFALVWISTLVSVIFIFLLALFFALPAPPVRRVASEQGTESGKATDKQEESQSDSFLPKELK